MTRFRLGTMDELREFLGQKEPALKTITIHTDRVLCDICNKDFSSSPATGGIYGLMTKAICPECAPQILADAERFGELKFIKARCPEGKRFADWVREDLR